MEDTFTLSIALEDLARVPADKRAQMFFGRLDYENPISHAGEARNESVPALEFTCPLMEAAAIIDLLRSWDAQANDKPTRAFVRAERVGAAWRKIPGHVALTLLRGDEVVVNRAALVIPETSTSAARDVAEAMPLRKR